MRSRTSCAFGMVAMLSLTLVSSPAELRAGDPCTPTATYTVMQTAVPTALVQIPQFNAATGDLCFAVVRITASYDALLKVENSANSMSIINVTATETINVDVPIFMSPAQGDITNADETFSDFAFVDAWDGGPDFSFMGTDWAEFSFDPNPKTVQIGFSAYNINSPGFNNFIGNGNLPDGFGVTGESEFSVNSNAGDYNAQATMRMSVKIEVEYHYVPEPATLSLLAGAFLMARRSRRRR